MSARGGRVCHRDAAPSPVLLLGGMMSADADEEDDDEIDEDVHESADDECRG